MEEREVILKVIRQLVKQDSSNGSKRDGFNADKRREGERERRDLIVKMGRWTTW